MAQRWMDRRFTFDLPVEHFPFVLERLRGLPPRAEDKTRRLPRAVLTRRLGNSWSIQENLGHLVDLEAVHMRRLDELAARAAAEASAASAALSAADPENRATWEAQHNDRSLDEVLASLRHARGAFVARLAAWEPAKRDVSALHPRLKQPMRVIDLAWFVAEHDDYHLARVQELIEIFDAEGT